MVEIAGPIHAMSVGARIVIDTGGNRFIPSEVIGFTGNNARGDAVRRPRRGQARFAARSSPMPQAKVRPFPAVARPRPQRDGRSDRRQGAVAAGSLADPLPQTRRRRRISRKARRRAARSRACGALNTFVTCCRGQRLGIFAGSGRRQVGLVVDAGAECRRRYHGDRAWSARRGREVQEFLQDDLGEEGLGALGGGGGDPPTRPALMRRQAAYLTLAIAEYFRDEDKDVLCLMDSVTRFAIVPNARIGLSGGRAADRQGLYADRVHRIAQAA